MSKKRFENCPYLYEINNDDNTVYAYAETAYGALKIAEKELDESRPITVKLVCFANNIINFK